MKTLALQMPFIANNSNKLKSASILAAVKLPINYVIKTCVQFGQVMEEYESDSTPNDAQRNKNTVIVLSQFDNIND